MLGRTAAITRAPVIEDSSRFNCAAMSCELILLAPVSGSTTLTLPELYWLPPKPGRDIVYRTMVLSLSSRVIRASTCLAVRSV